MITIEHYQDCVVGDFGMAIDDDFMYAIGQRPPNYLMPAIRYETMLVNWHGKMQLIVVYPNQWCGYATMVADYAFDRKP